MKLTAKWTSVSIADGILQVEFPHYFHHNIDTFWGKLVIYGVILWACMWVCVCVHAFLLFFFLLLILDMRHACSYLLEVIDSNQCRYIIAPALCSNVLFYSIKALIIITHTRHTENSLAFETDIFRWIS